MGFTDIGPVASSVTRVVAAQRPAPRGEGELSLGCSTLAPWMRVGKA